MKAFGEVGRTSSLGYRVLALGALACALSACVEAPPPRPYRAMRVVEAPPAPPPDTTVYAYPQQGQTPEQLDRDRYECYVWASKQTGFDPSAPSTAPREQVRVVMSGPPAPPPGAQTAAGALTGAVLGAAVSRPRDAGAGALVGAVIGGVIGASAEAAQNQRAEANAQALDNIPPPPPRLDPRAADYRRAMSACLEGRGYSVK